MIFCIVLLARLASAITAGRGSIFDIPLSEVYFFSAGEGNQYFDEYFLMNVTFGTPPQEFVLLPDTGSSDTWVQGPKLGSPAFMPKKSSSFVNLTKPWLFEYGGPEKKIITYASGYAARDRVAILGADKTISLKHKTFAVAQAGKGNPIRYTQGVFGLTIGAHVSSYGAPVYLVTAIRHGLLREALFGVHFTRTEDVKPLPPRPPRNTRHLGVREKAGKITLGGVDKALFKEPFTYAPVQPHKGFWQVALDGIYVNGKLVETTKEHVAIVDTGTGPLVLPPKVAADFFDHFGGTKTKFFGLYYVPCSTIVDVKVKIAGKFFPIKAQDLNFGYADTSHKNCYANIAGIHATGGRKNGTYPAPNRQEIIVLGLPFLLNAYTVFDFSHGGRVGFADLEHNGDLPTIAPIDVADKTKPESGNERVIESNEDYSLRRFRIGI